MHPLHPWLSRGTRAVIFASLLTSLGTHAHNVWLEPDAQGGYRVQFGGHAGQLEAFDPAKLQTVKAYDRRGRPVEAQVEKAAQGLRVVPSPKAATIAVELDNGYFSGPAGGELKNLPMDENPGATRGVHARKSHKTIVAWNALTQRELGQLFEIVPAQGRTPHAGDWLELQVQLNGQPAPGVRVSLGENGPALLTDSQGRSKVQVTSGTNHIQAILRLPVQGNPKTTENSYEALFSFAAH